MNKTGRCYTLAFKRQQRYSITLRQSYVLASFKLLFNARVVHIFGQACLVGKAYRCRKTAEHQARQKS
jgi:hypothetical protein